MGKHATSSFSHERSGRRRDDGETERPYDIERLATGDRVWLESVDRRDMTYQAD